MKMIGIVDDIGGLALTSGARKDGMTTSARRMINSLKWEPIRALALCLSLGLGGARQVTEPNEVRLALPQGAAAASDYAGPLVTVTGLVVYNEQPLRGAALQWNTAAGETATEVFTNGGGAYTVSLDRAGEYTLVIRAEGFQPQLRTVVVDEGPTTYDVNFKGGTVIVRLLGWDQASETVVDFMTRGASHSAIVQPGEEPVIKVQGLAFGSYKIAAYQKRRGVVQGRDVVIDEDHPEKVVEITLSARRVAPILNHRSGDRARDAYRLNTHLGRETPDPSVPSIKLKHRRSAHGTFQVQRKSVDRKSFR